MPTTVTISDLPDELIYLILTFLPLDFYSFSTKCRAVCRKWRQISLKLATEIFTYELEPSTANITDYESGLILQQLYKTVDVKLEKFPFELDAKFENPSLIFGTALKEFKIPISKSLSISSSQSNYQLFWINLAAFSNSSVIFLFCKFSIFYKFYLKRCF